MTDQRWGLALKGEHPFSLKPFQTKEREVLKQRIISKA